MAGRVVTISGRQTYSVNVTASTSSIVYLGPRVIATPECVSGILLVRVSAFTIATGNIKLGLANSMLMPDDPGNLYLAGSSDPLSASPRCRSRALTRSQRLGACIPKRGLRDAVRCSPRT